MSLCPYNRPFVSLIEHYFVSLYQGNGGSFFGHGHITSLDFFNWFVIVNFDILCFSYSVFNIVLHRYQLWSFTPEYVYWWFVFLFIVISGRGFIVSYDKILFSLFIFKPLYSFTNFLLMKVISFLDNDELLVRMG